MSKILRTRRHHLGKTNLLFPCLIITESPWIESDLHIPFVLPDCVFAAHGTPEKPQQLASFTKQCVQ